MGVDVLTQAKSGMGKTAIFVLSVLNQLDEKSDPLSCLILAHTRELAYQIKKEFDRFTKYNKIKSAVVYGGEPIQNNIKTIKDEAPQVLVGTPGRVLGLVKGKYIKFDKLKYFILDECDKLLDQVG